MNFEQVNIADNYRILGRLGTPQQRKFNEVFVVQHKQSNERAVMKVLLKLDNNTHLRERLRQEARFDFKQEGLPATLDFYESENELMLIRSYIEGVPLNEFMSGVRRRQKAETILTVLEGLVPLFATLQHERIVHLDIKPTNILIDKQPDGSLKTALIDFGMAMRQDEPRTTGTLFALGYSAPELLLNRLHLADQRTDLFALGISLWQCLAGRLPLLHPNPGIMTNLQLTHPLPEDDAIPRKVQQVLSKLCTKHVFRLPPNRMPETEVDAALAEAMSKRYYSLDDVAKDWQLALEPTRWWSRSV